MAPSQSHLAFLDPLMESISFYAVSTTNRSGLIIIAETLFMTWMIIVNLIRLYMRLAINGPVKIDDAVVFTGSVIAIAHVGTIIDATSHGLGRSEDESSASDLIRAGKVALPILEPPNLAFSAARKKNRRIKEKETDDNAWKIITAFDVITDILTFGLCILLVWGVQMRRKQKWAVIFAFGTRAPVVILIILRQTYLERSLFHSNAPLHLSSAMILTAILLHCSIMVSTVPCLKPFVMSFNTGWGQGVTNGNGQNSYLTPTGKSASANQSHFYSMNRGEEVEAYWNNSRLSQDSQHSQRLIIHQVREWKVEEQYEMHSVQNKI
ncbi:hypothetical protein PEX1_039470 [Penicillium expansum]|uniref:Rhodopsin domain-containing protein n=1 Tax=Penicillium expansum TaxID=27334 RepID=A0A0A2IQ54_PENEN|nr:hypothetical protein PEX2_064060 [Penicillium expansum]KGO43778.1 hypothetical protein PEXP_093490 [Penicillium expansum]KGO44631.1 hypothetical protein PEX1_039470 [Penicillium expansum]KGO51944.1 hypothetical protein PEX2_064060 [Penicillium expansum]